MGDGLRDIVNRQRALLTELDRQVGAIESDEMTRENQKLRAELEKLQAAHSQLEQRATALTEQNTGLKNALYEQAYNEKLQIIQKSMHKIEVYFQSTALNEANRLAALEYSASKRIHELTTTLYRNNVELDNELQQRLGELSRMVNFKVTQARQLMAQTKGPFSDNEYAAFQDLKNEQITGEQILAVTKKNNIERFVGLNLINIIGIVLIIVGVITAARYTYVYLPDNLKGVMMFVLGGLMLAAGEWMNRKKPNIFSLGITAGGVGVLYAALAMSYFALGILGMFPALGICILVTALTFYLSTRYQAQTILAIALAGGYLPIFSISANKTMLYGAMVYFVLLNLLALFVSFRKKWSVASFIGLGLNIIGTFTICSEFGYDDPIGDHLAAVLYVFFAFMVYTVIPLAGTYVNKLQFKKRDVVLLSINTFFSSFILFSLFYYFEWEQFTGLLAALFAASYLSLSLLIRKKFDSARATTALFTITGLAFVVLVIPFQFGSAWLSLGWLAEGVGLSIYGILKSNKSFRRYGFIINALCVAAFLLFDVSGLVENLFLFKYLAITLGSLGILGAYMVKKTLSGLWQKMVKYATVVNLWLFCLYLSLVYFERLLIRSGYASLASGLTDVMSVAFTFIIAYFALRIRILSDLGIKIIAVCLYGLGIVALLEFNTQPYLSGPTPLPVSILATAALVLVSLFSVYAVHDITKLVVMGRKLSVEWYPLIVSAYFVVLLTQNLIVRFGLSFAGAWISIFYVCTALAWILVGFAKRYGFLRKFGLGLALLSVAKLFLIDLSSLTEGYRIITYFSLGIILVGISFVYQYFSKRLELKPETVITPGESSAEHPFAVPGRTPAEPPAEPPAQPPKEDA